MKFDRVPKERVLQDVVNHTRRYLIADVDEGYFDVYFFAEDVITDELEDLIREHKANHHTGACADWSLESIEEEIRKHYKVERVVLFELDYNAKYVMEI